MTRAGLVIKTQGVIISELQDRLRTTFGNNVNLDDRSVFGQLIGIWSEREALVWELMQAVYASSYPNGAEGVSVDNILALSNMHRLGATPSVTNPAIVPRGDGVTLYGLSLYGTPGTRVTAGSIIRDLSSPPLSFRLDADVVIQPAVDAQQAIIFSDVPDAGAMTLTVPSYRTASGLSARVAAGVLADVATVTFTGTLTTGHYYVMVEGNLAGPFVSMSAIDIQVAIEDFGADFADTSCFHLDDIDTHPMRLYIGPRPGRATFNPTQVDWSGAVSTGSYRLVVAGTQTTAAIASLAAADVQAALRALGGDYRSVYVYSDLTAHKVWVNWGNVSPTPSLTVASNTTGVTPTVHASNTTAVTFTVIESLRAIIGTLLDADGVRPYSDVGATSSAGNIFVVAFGAHAPASGQPSSGDRSVPLMTVSANSMTSGGGLVTPQVAQYAEGSPARGIGSATCTVDGPNAVAAGRLSVIGSPADGWASVSNELDVIPGTTAETDLQALARRETLLNAQATGPLEAIAAAVRKVTGVTTATAFQNLTDAALQRIVFTGAPSTGTWMLRAPALGLYTAALGYGADSAAVQDALAALPGMEPVLVSGSAADGFTIDFNGAMGGQAQPLLELWNNTTDVGISVRFGRPPKAVEVLVIGGERAEIAAAIYGKIAAGIQAYGAPVQTTTAVLAEGEVDITVTDAIGIDAGIAVFGAGISAGTTVVRVSGTTVTLTAPALVDYAASEMIFANVVRIADSFGNQTPIGFTRPTPVLVYVTVSLVTDTYRIPGNPTSGPNPQAKFQPSSMSAIQADLLAIGSAFTPGGLIIGRGTGGLIGAFNEADGIVDYTLHFGLTPLPSGDSPIQLQPDQAPVFQLGTIAVSFS